MAEKKIPSRVYTVIIESANQWHVAIIGVPVGAAADNVRTLAEAHVAQDEDLPPDATIRLVMPIEPLLEAMEEFKEVLKKMGATQQFIG